MFTSFVILVLLALRFIFRKKINAWLASYSDPLAPAVKTAETYFSSTFGKRAVPPDASVGDPDVTVKKV